MRRVHRFLPFPGPAHCRATAPQLPGRSGHDGAGDDLQPGPVADVRKERQDVCPGHAKDRRHSGQGDGRTAGKTHGRPFQDLRHHQGTGEDVRRRGEIFGAVEGQGTRLADRRRRAVGEGGKPRIRHPRRHGLPHHLAPRRRRKTAIADRPVPRPSRPRGGGLPGRDHRRDPRRRGGGDGGPGWPPTASSST